MAVADDGIQRERQRREI